MVYVRMIVYYIYAIVYIFYMSIVYKFMVMCVCE